MKQTKTILLTLLFFSIIGTSNCPVACCQTPDAQNPESGLDADVEMPLTYFDPLMADFIKLDKDQVAQFAEIRLQWQKEFRRLKQAAAERRQTFSAYKKHEDACDAILTDKQRSELKRFNTFRNSGPAEFRVLERAVRLGGIELAKSQIEKIQQLEKRWILWVDDEFEETFSDNWDTIGEDQIALRRLKDLKGAEYRNAILEVLDGEQVKRLAQLQWQNFVTRQGVYSFNNEQVTELLKLTEAQRTEIKTFIDEMESESDRFKAMGMRMDGYKKFSNSLTDDQKSKWNNTLGEPFLVTNLRWLFEFMSEVE